MQRIMDLHTKMETNTLTDEDRKTLAAIGWTTIGLAVVAGGLLVKKFIK